MHLTWIYKFFFNLVSFATSQHSLHTTIIDCKIDIKTKTHLICVENLDQNLWTLDNNNNVEQL